MSRNQNHFSIIIINKINNALNFNQIIINKLNSFSKVIRKKRGLFDGVGKLSKWLFGTLDADDEQFINNYIKRLDQNEIKLNTGIAEQQTLLKEMTDKYKTNFETLWLNQKTLQNQVSNLQKEINQLVSFEQAFSFGNTIDNLILQLHLIYDLINNIETALAFGKLNTLHSSIIGPEKLGLLINKLNEIYKYRQIPYLQNIMNYYNLFSTQVNFKNNLILFKIHCPIVTNPFQYFRMYPVPISNLILLPEHPFLMLNTEEYWTTMERCPEIENVYYCQQSRLHRSQPCLANIIRTGRNDCHGINIHLNETTIMQINSHQVMVIPVEHITVQANCETNGIFTISKPSVISLEGCHIRINDKLYQAEESIHDELVFELPKLNFSTNTNHFSSVPIKLKTINENDVKHLQVIANNLQTPDLNTTHNGHAWTNTSIIIGIIILSCLLVTYIKYIKPRKRVNKAENGSQNRSPLFSELKEGGDM